MRILEGFEFPLFSPNQNNKYLYTMSKQLFENKNPGAFDRLSLTAGIAWDGTNLGTEGIAAGTNRSDRHTRMCHETRALLGVQ